MIKRTIHQEDKLLITIFEPNLSTKNINQLLKGERDKNTSVVGALNTSLTAMDRSSKQKISKERSALN